jgi:Domain of unknown function (DUF4917)
MPEVLTFRGALDEAQGLRHRHLLLGNGFSIACRADIFQYAKLFERADFQMLSAGARLVFDTFRTQDFERVIKALRDTRSVLGGYRPADDDLVGAIQHDADGLREVLVQAIAGSHPARPSDIPDSEYESCRRFLAPFERIYTVNYDLLMYWTQMHEPSEVRLYHDDGFRKPEDDTNAAYVTWDSSGGSSQTTFYLHGGLHLVDTGIEIRKLTWTNTGIALIDQIQAALNDNLYPLFVSEGSSREKLTRIKHSDYLARSLRSLREIQGALFIYGLSLADNDEHVLKQIERGKVSHLFASLHGDARSPTNQLIMRRAKQLSARRARARPLSVAFYDAESAHVWR